MRTCQTTTTARHVSGMLLAARSQDKEMRCRECRVLVALLPCTWRPVLPPLEPFALHPPSPSAPSLHRAVAVRRVRGVVPQAQVSPLGAIPTGPPSSGCFGLPRAAATSTCIGSLALLLFPFPSWFPCLAFLLRRVAAKHDCKEFTAPKEKWFAMHFGHSRSPVPAFIRVFGLGLGAVPAWVILEMRLRAAGKKGRARGERERGRDCR
jgi:hypothetical protein